MMSSVSEIFIFSFMSAQQQETDRQTLTSWLWGLLLLSWWHWLGLLQLLNLNSRDGGGKFAPLQSGTLAGSSHWRSIIIIIARLFFNYYFVFTKTTWVWLNVCLEKEEGSCQSNSASYVWSITLKISKVGPSHWELQHVLLERETVCRLSVCDFQTEVELCYIDDVFCFSEVILILTDSLKHLHDTATSSSTFIEL